MANVIDVSTPSRVKVGEKFTVTVTVKGTPDLGENRDDFRLRLYDLTYMVDQKVDDTIQDGNTKEYSFDVTVNESGIYKLCARTEELPFL